MYSGTVVQSGTVFLILLRRRIGADYRLHLLETALVAALAGALSMLRIERSGAIIITNPIHGLTTAVIAAVAWLVIGALLYRTFIRLIREYITALLVETGLLYLVLEHDPHDALAPLRRREHLARLNLNAQSALSFRGRMLLFLRTYTGCAGALGFHAYPEFIRRLGRILDYGLLLCAGLFAILVWRSVQDALAYQAIALVPLKLSAWVVLLLVLSRSVLSLARKFGLWQALTDLLIDEEAGGRALLAGGG